MYCFVYYFDAKYNFRIIVVFLSFVFHHLCPAILYNQGNLGSIPCITWSDTYAHVGEGRFPSSAPSLGVGVERLSH